MAARHVELFSVSSPDELEDLEACLHAGQFEAVLVDIPDGSQTLATAREFRRVINAARAADIEVEFSTEDPLRRELARIVGARVASSGPVSLRDADAATRQIDRPAHNQATTRTTTAERLSERQVPFRPFQRPSVVEPSDDAVEDIEYDTSNPSFSFVINPPVPRRPDLETTRARRTPAGPTTADLYEVWDGYRPAPATSSTREARQRKKHLRRVTLTMVLVAAVVASSIGGALFLLPRATVAITPVVTDVHADLTYGVALPGQSWDIMVEPMSVSSTLTFSATIPATGERVEPDGTATGNVLFSNASPIPVTVFQGTLMTTATGVQFVTQEDITIPAADPFGTLTMGSATVPIIASTAGLEGNVAAEALYGQLENGVFFTNREPTSGGSVKHITTVSAADLDALRQRAETDLHAQAATAIAAQLALGQQVIEGSEQRGAVEFSFDRVVGEDAESVRVDASLGITAQVFSLDGIHDQAREMVEQRLQQQSGQAAILMRDTVSISAPQLIAGSNGTAFAVSASASTKAAISDTSLAALANDLRGLSPDSALARIQQIPGVETVTVEYGPDWLTRFDERMPRRESQITIEVRDAQGVPAQAQKTRP
jgi:hypothetical protein